MRPNLANKVDWGEVEIHILKPLSLSLVIHVPTHYLMREELFDSSYRGGFDYWHLEVDEVVEYDILQLGLSLEADIPLE